jgi:hypothetical protein
MKSIEQIAEIAYTEYMRVRQANTRGACMTFGWSALDTTTKSAWISAIQKVRDEIAAVH